MVVNSPTMLQILKAVTKFVLMRKFLAISALMLLPLVSGAQVNLSTELQMPADARLTGEPQSPGIEVENALLDIYFLHRTQHNQVNEYEYV